MNTNPGDHVAINVYSYEEFSLVYGRYASSLYGFILAEMQNENSSTLILQQTFVTAYAKREAFAKTALGMFCWLRQIACNAIKDFKTLDTTTAV